ncbi:MAG: sigma-70 family RNA polymerase sigma factor [Deltaproteobacteria bacterium]|nr:sigma-70 family RNA polymerase sigma factor [Deltaproteobacteria bacterium]
MELGVQRKTEQNLKKGASQRPPTEVDVAQALHDRDRLIEQYLPYATSIANKVARSLSGDVDYDDILCNARLGLLEAARRFDSRFNVDFRTFAFYRIKGAIYDGLRKTGWMPRSLYAKIKFDQAATEYMQTATEKILDRAEGVKAEIEVIFETVNSLASMYVMSLDNMEDFEVEDKAARRDIEHKAEFQKVKEKMRDAIEILPDKERKLVKMYYFQNKTLEEIGAKMSLSKSWTSRLHARALELLFKKLTQMNAKIPGQEQKVEGETLETAASVDHQEEPFPKAKGDFVGGRKSGEE